MSMFDQLFRYLLSRRLLSKVMALLCLAFGSIAIWQPTSADQEQMAEKEPVQEKTVQAKKVIELNIKGAIGPATSDYVTRGLEQAKERGAELVILRMDTPGGLDFAMRDIIQEILASPVPVASYVSPSGSRAASAGTYILYASHVAAMAPATTLGAATPVQIGGIPGMPEAPGEKPGDKDGQDNEQQQPAAEDEGTAEADKADKAEKTGADKQQAPLSGTAMERKITNDAAAYIRGLANRHGRNAEWAERAVREAVSLSAQEALEQNVIDLVATDISDLLKQVDGRTVKMESGELVLATENASVQVIEPDWRSRLLSVITDPNVAYILMLIGIYGLFFELANPGVIFPGVIGAICLILALYAFQVLPINYTGLALIILGLLLMLGEALVPSFGIMGIGGVIAFVIGSIMLMKEDNLSISLPLIGGTALVSAGFFLWAIARVISLRRKQFVSGAEQMIGKVAEALEDFTGHGYVWVHSERWAAESTAPIKKGQSVEIVAIDGLKLKIKPLKEE